MPAPMFIPPWLRPVDFTDTYQRGVQIGAQIAAQQASERAAAQAAAQRAQEAAMEQARWEEDFRFRAAEAAKRTQAQLDFSRYVQGGMDPVEALMKSGYEAGTGMAQMYREREREKRESGFTPSVVDIGGGQRAARLGPNHYQLVTAPMPEGTQATPITDSTGKVIANLYGNRVLPVSKATTEKRLPPEKQATMDTLKTDYSSALTQLRSAQIALMKDPENEAILELRRNSLRQFNAARSNLEKFIAGLETESDLPDTTTPPAATASGPRFRYNPESGLPEEIK